MNPTEFDALLLKPQGFNTLDNLANSAANKQLSQQSLQAIQTMQTPLPQGHLPQHVVLPIFQKNEDNVTAHHQEETNIFAIINGVQKGPFTLEQLKGLAIADVIDVESLVWMPSLSKWTDLKTFLTNYKQ